MKYLKVIDDPMKIKAWFANSLVTLLIVGVEKTAGLIRMKINITAK